MTTPSEPQKHTHNSSLREQYIEYAFLGLLCQEMWRRGQAMDILRSHTDRSGYDILLEVDGMERHVQLKSSFIGATTAKQDLHVRLVSKPSGCVIWVWFDEATFELHHFLWIGSAPGQPLPPLGDRIAKHSMANKEGEKAERPNIRRVPKGRFETIASIAALADHLFGEVQNSEENLKIRVKKRESRIST